MSTETGCRKRQKAKSVTFGRCDVVEFIIVEADFHWEAWDEALVDGTDDF